MFQVMPEKLEKPTEWGKEKISIEAIKALSGCHSEWENVAQDQISIKDVSGFGGNRTYKITRSVDDHVLGEVAFHLVGENSNYNNQPDLLSVQKSMTIACASAELCPSRLTEKEDQFFINHWFKNSKCVEAAHIDVNLAKQLGILLAKIHLIDPQWYTSHYEKLLTKYPALVDAPRGSAFWYMTTRNWPLMFKEKHATNMDSWMKRISETHRSFIDVEIQPISAAGQRIVTTHGDFHQGNILLSEKGVLNIIDFESSHVSFAIQDISYYFWAKSITGKENKLAFASAYLKEMGYPYEEADAVTLALDAERCILSTGFMSTIFEAFVKNEKISDSDLNQCHRLKLFAHSVLEDKELVEIILEKGIAKCKPFVCLGNFFCVRRGLVNCD